MKRKQDGALLIIVALIIFAMFAILRLTGAQGAYVTLTQDGVTIGRYSLYESQVFDVTNADGHTNTVRIEDGAVSVTDADCPDRLCVRQGTISRSGENIICLPHKLTLTITADDTDGIDAVAQ